MVQPSTSRVVCGGVVLAVGCIFAPALSRAAGSLALVSWDTEQICSAHPFASAALLRFFFFIYFVLCLAHPLLLCSLRYLFHMLFPLVHPLSSAVFCSCCTTSPLIHCCVEDCFAPWGHYSPFVLPVHSSPARWLTVVL